MAQIVKATAFANNEVAFIAWSIDAASIPGCLGFEIVREYLDGHDQVTERRPLASYVAFKGQSNPGWLPQNTTVWPVQKFNWRDLTLRKRRDALRRRPEGERVRYAIRAVGDAVAGKPPVVVVTEKSTDPAGRETANTYSGAPRPLCYLTDAAFTNAIEVTAKRGPFTTTFTNGILSTQFLSRVLEQRAKLSNNSLETILRTPGDPIRDYLSGDVVVTMTGFFDRFPTGRVKAALYELEDVELVDALMRHADRIDLILSDAGDRDADAKQGIAAAYDQRNREARAQLRAIAGRPGSHFTLQDRLFNGSGHIGHNKFLVHVDDQGRPDAVLTGSTNWTWSGVSAQSNNCIVIEDAAVAAAYLDYWTRLHADVQPTPQPDTTAPNPGAGQGDPLKRDDTRPRPVTLAGGTATIWFSPNMPGRSALPSARSGRIATPPDMSDLFSTMRKAQRSILFLVFLPSRGGLHSIIEEAVDIGLKDHSLDVIGAISDPQAMWAPPEIAKAAPATAPGAPKPKTSAPTVFREAGVSLVRATALTDKVIGRKLGNFRLDERLKTGVAIIHDKILVIDPQDPSACVVAFGSHNLGYKASYTNDENLMIVRGHQPLALAYAAHVLDVYDHYRFRAVEADRAAEAKAAEAAGRPAERAEPWDGFLSTDDTWQRTASRRLSKLFC